MTTAIERLDAEIQRFQQEAAAVEQAGPSFDERWPEIEAQLLDAETIFRRHGPCISSFAPVLPEMAYRCHQAAVGAAMVVNAKALLDSERARIKAETASGIPAADRARRLAELRRAVSRTAAQREIELRRIEGDGFMVRPPLHAELAVFTQAAVERLAAAR